MTPGGAPWRTVLVTGAGGFIGRHLLRRLRSMESARVIALRRRNHPGSAPAGDETVFSDLAELTPATWSRLDVGEVDVVFHLGSFTPKTSAPGDAVEEVYRSNLAGTRMLLESLPPTETLVFASSIDVYGPPVPHPFREDTRPCPQSLYAASKLFCERLVEVHMRRTGGRSVVLRYGHVYGPGEEEYGKLIPATIRSLLKGQRPTVRGSGDTRRDYVYVDDVVEGTIRAACARGEGASLLNIAAGRPTTVGHVVQELMRLSGMNGAPAAEGEGGGGTSLLMACDRMCRELGSWELVPLEEGLRRELEYMRDAVA